MLPEISKLKGLRYIRLAQFLMKNHNRHNLNRSVFLHSSTTGEDPWDGAGYGARQPKARVMSWWGHAPSLFITGIVLTLSLLLLAGTGHGQNAPKADNHRHGNLMKMDKETRKLAEEYAYLLEQLIYLSTDYCLYFERLDDKDAAQNYKSLRNLCSNLSRSGYYDNLEELVREIEELKGELSLRKKSLSRARKRDAQHTGEIKRTKESLKALRLTTSLLTELDALEEQLVIEVVSKTAADKTRRRVIQQYVVTVMGDSIARLAEVVTLTSVPKIRVKTGINGSGKQIYVTSERSAPVVIAFPEIPEVAVISKTQAKPKLPNIPKIQEIQRGQNLGYFYSNSSNKFVKTLRDSISLSGESEIMIINPFGKMSITGWDNDQVSATYDISIVSVNPGLAEKFGRQIQIRMFEEKNNVYIEAVVPKLTDLRTRITESHLNLMVPLKNDLKINNSAGQINLSELENNIKIKAGNTFIDLFKIEGDVEIVNSGGNIELERVSGNILVQNRMGGPVSIQNCNGRIEVDNSHGSVEITYCEGQLTVRNSGRIDIEHHSGTVHVNNRNGFVSANHIDGDLVIFNSFEPLKVYNVTGSARLENANAVIEAENIGGSLDISNRYGKIFTSFIVGPINIQSSNGDVFMELFEQLTGKSSVVASGGRIILGLSPRIDLLLTMETQNGVIDVTDFQTIASSDLNGLQTARVELGKGSNLLAVKGNRSKIIVKESH